MLNTITLEEEGLKAQTYGGLDLEASLDGIIWDAETFKYADRVYRYMCQPTKWVLKNEVEKLMDVELQSFGVDIQRRELNYPTKAATISKYRWLEKTSAYGTPTPKFIKRGKEREFEKHLEYFIGGHPGSPRRVILYFTYRTPFIQFLSALQEATQLCTIPPIDFQIPRTREDTTDIPVFSSFPRSDGKLGGKYRNQSASRTITKNGHDMDSMATEEPLMNDLPLDITSTSQRRTEKGFTLEDGPWMCQKFSTSASSTKVIPHGERLEICKESEYLDLVEVLKDANATSMGTEFIVAVMHSMEYRLKHAWEIEKETEKIENQCSNNVVLDELASRTLEEKEEKEANDFGMKRILDDLGIEESADDEMGEFAESWMETWNRLKG